MLSDIEIAQNAKMLKIKDIAKELGIDEEELIPYGHYKAKISQECIDRLESKEGRAILHCLDRIIIHKYSTTSLRERARRLLP